MRSRDEPTKPTETPRRPPRSDEHYDLRPGNVEAACSAFVQQKIYVEPKNFGGIGEESTPRPWLRPILDNIKFVTDQECFTAFYLEHADLKSRGSPPMLVVESGEAGPLARARALAGLGIRFWRKKSIDIELLLSDSDRPKGPWHTLLRGTCDVAGHLASTSLLNVPQSLTCRAVSLLVKSPSRAARVLLFAS